MTKNNENLFQLIKIYKLVLKRTTETTEQIETKFIIVSNILFG